MKYILPLTLLFVQSCTSLSQGGANVKVVGRESVASLKGCQKLKLVEATPGGRAGGGTKENLLIDLRNDTAEIGGNVVVTESKVQTAAGGFSMMMKGLAFKCTAVTYNELIDLSEL